MSKLPVVTGAGCRVRGVCGHATGFLILAIGMAELGCSPVHTNRHDNFPAPQWGDEGYSALPLVRDTPSIVKIKGMRDDFAIMWELSEDGNYYRAYVGVNLPERFDKWFVLKVTKEGKVYREMTDPKTLELKWVPDNGSAD